MQTILKLLGLILFSMYLTACSSGGGSGGDAGGGSPTNPSIPDSNPHDYRIDIGREAAGITINNDLEMVCDFGLSTEHTTNSVVPLSDGNPTSALAQNGCKNVTIELQNQSAFNIVYQIEVDGVITVSATLAAGQTYTFQRGF